MCTVIACPDLHKNGVKLRYYQVPTQFQTRLPPLSLSLALDLSSTSLFLKQGIHGQPTLSRATRYLSLSVFHRLKAYAPGYLSKLARRRDQHTWATATLPPPRLPLAAVDMCCPYRYKVPLLTCSETSDEYQAENTLHLTHRAPLCSPPSDDTAEEVNAFSSQVCTQA